MPLFDVQTPDGRKFQVDAPDMQSAARALSDYGGEQNKNHTDRWWKNDPIVPAFDPSKPYETVTSVPPFDPSKPYEAVKGPPKIIEFEGQRYEFPHDATENEIARALSSRGGQQNKNHTDQWWKNDPIAPASAQHRDYTAVDYLRGE